ncbi:Hypothetical protein D9617_3g022800 [Elsinoe fawcettii]|nr:Hypothetical protein D9617_3g022800 [Elsinoe fawcettii]
MLKSALLFAALLPASYTFQFIENWLCPKVGGTLLPAIPNELKNRVNRAADYQQPLNFDHVPPRPLSQSKCSSLQSYTALGDSYSAGLGASVRLGQCNSSSDPPSSTTCTLAGCSKDTGSYGYLFAKEYGIQDFQYLPCSGANTSTVFEDQISSKYFNTPDGQSPQVVSITVGGDDLGFFVDLVMTCVLTLEFNGTTCAGLIDNSKTKLPTIASNVRSLFQALKKRIGPDTTVVAMGYPAPFGQLDDESGAGQFCPLSPEAGERAGINGLVAQMNTIIARAAATFGFIYGDVDAAWKGHRWCDNGPFWFDDVLCDREIDTAGQEYFNIAFAHPLLAGQAAYLDVLKNSLGC